ncbi:Noc2p family-domain-containing protein [Choanephora cucurbitarum]|nr:Noc2p family-domain-containing protein [Choanephora cucurbitarum]
MGKEKKSTIKFQKNKLKGVISRRKEVNKFKKQIAKRQARRTGSKNPHKETEESLERAEDKQEATIEETPKLNTEDYFCNFVIDDEEPLDLSDDEEEDLNALDGFEALATKDELVVDEGLDHDMEDGDEENEEEEEEDPFDDEEDEDMSNAEIVTIDMINEWSTQANTKSPLAWKKLLLAFRSIVRTGEDHQFCYRVDNSKVYTKVVRNTLLVAYPILSQHIYFLKKEKYPGKTKNWPKLEKVVRLFLNNCVRFLRELTEDDIIQYVLEKLEPCTLYFGCFPKLSREYLRVLLDRWSDTALSEETRNQCFKALHQLGTTALDANRKNYMPNVLKGVYLIFANRATKINQVSLPVLQQMIEEAADLYAVDHQLSYEHASVYIRQLADHLKGAKKKNTAESFKKIYTWQYINCLDFWASAVSATCDPSVGEHSPMQSIVHPLVEVTLHTIRLNPTPSFLPLRIHLVRTLTGLMDGTGYYIPLAPYLFEILSSDVLKGQQPSVDGLPEFEWQLHLKTPKSYVQTKEYQTAVYNVMYDCLVDFYGCVGLSIAFPELVIPAIVKLKEYQSKMKGTRFVKSLRTLIEKMETHKNYIEQKRAPIEYTANNLQEANAFLRTTDFQTTPLGQFLKKRSQSS